MFMVLGEIEDQTYNIVLKTRHTSVLYNNGQAYFYQYTKPS